MMHNSINNRWTRFILTTLLIIIIILSKFLSLTLTIPLSLVIGIGVAWDTHHLRHHCSTSNQSEYNHKTDIKERRSHDQDR